MTGKMVIAEYSFCESIHAGARSPWHIRKLTSAGPKLGGGIDTKSLCGNVERGWDLNVEITQYHLTHACTECCTSYGLARGHNNGEVRSE
jgi:hypothetical protein